MFKSKSWTSRERHSAHGSVIVMLTLVAPARIADVLLALAWEMCVSARMERTSGREAHGVPACALDGRWGTRP